MKLAVFTATQRGLRFLQRLWTHVAPRDVLVYSFRETRDEPPFFDAIQLECARQGAQLIELPTGKRPTLESMAAAASADMLWAVSWRYLLPASIFSAPKLGAFAIHDSLLPAYRGFSPTVWAMAAGEPETGATLFAMTEQMDAGDVLGQIPVPIGPRETIGEVMQRVTQAYLQLLDEHLPAMLRGQAPRVPQDHGRATYCCRRTSLDNWIDWRRSAAEISNLVRAVTVPYSGASTSLQGQRLTIWSASVSPESRRFVGRTPGRIVQIGPGGVVVLAGEGEVVIDELQRHPGARLKAHQVLKSTGLTLGDSRSLPLEGMPGQ